MTTLEDYAYLQELPAHLKDYGLQAYQRIREDYKDNYYSTIVQGHRDYGNREQVLPSSSLHPSQAHSMQRNT